MPGEIEKYVTKEFCAERVERLIEGMKAVDSKISIVLDNMDEKIKTHNGQIKTAQTDIDNLEKITIIMEAIKKEIQRRNAITITITSTCVGILSLILGNLGKIITLLKG